MSDAKQPAVGGITWHDLTISDAPRVRDFYAAVVGWNFKAESMGEYEDSSMIDSSGTTVAAVCHARGTNRDIPPQWLIYITVADVDRSARSVA